MSIHAHSAHSHHHRHAFRSKREAPTAEMPPLRRLVVRDNKREPTALTPAMVNLLIALLVLVLFGIILIAALMVLRARRTRQQRVAREQAEKIAGSQSDLPVYTSPSRTSHKSNHRRLTITAAPYGRNSKPIYSYSEKEVLMNDSQPTSPIPEIRITFPEEEDEMGKRKSGRVVVVSVSDMGSVGLEPLHDGKEGLPAYEGGDWKELDLEQIGGLKEIERRS